MAVASSGETFTVQLAELNAALVRMPSQQMGSARQSTELTRLTAAAAAGDTLVCATTTSFCGVPTSQATSSSIDRAVAVAGAVCPAGHLCIHATAKATNGSCVSAAAAIGREILWQYSDNAGAMCGSCAGIDFKCGAVNNGAVCPLGTTCRDGACVVTMHAVADMGDTLSVILGDDFYSENYGGACSGRMLSTSSTRCSANYCGPRFGHAVCSFGRACGSNGTCVDWTDGTAAHAAIADRSDTWFIYDDGYSGVCDAGQIKASTIGAPCGDTNGGAVCGPRHVCNSVTLACEEDFTLGFPTSPGEAAADNETSPASFLSAYSHDFGGASYKTTVTADAGDMCGFLATFPSALAAAAQAAEDESAAAALTESLQTAAATATTAVKTSIGTLGSLRSVTARRARSKANVGAKAMAALERAARSPHALHGSISSSAMHDAWRRAHVGQPYVYSEVPYMVNRPTVCAAGLVCVPTSAAVAVGSGVCTAMSSSVAIASSMTLAHPNQTGVKLSAWYFSLGGLGVTMGRITDAVYDATAYNETAQRGFILPVRNSNGYNLLKLLKCGVGVGACPVGLRCYVAATVTGGGNNLALYGTDVMGVCAGGTASTTSAIAESSSWILHAGFSEGRGVAAQPLPQTCSVTRCGPGPRPAVCAPGLTCVKMGSAVGYGSCMLLGDSESLTTAGSTVLALYSEDVAATTVPPMVCKPLTCVEHESATCGVTNGAACGKDLLCTPFTPGDWEGPSRCLDARAARLSATRLGRRFLLR